MQIIENSKIKEKEYIYKLENGLTVLVIPKKGVNKKYITWGVNYGSIDNEFIVPGEKEPTKIPDGVAHYLEHKLFEQENGVNSLDALTSLGVNANAYTGNDHTAYLYECTDNFYEALDEFMDYVQHPYFTDENVEKEKGIIGQEIMMYDDYPEFRVYMNGMKALYHNSPVRIDIAGTKESIAQITKETLYKCYNTFYTPSNMAIVVCGDFNPDEIVEEIKKRLVKEFKGREEIKRIYPEEPKDICKKEIKDKMDISMPLFFIGFKDAVMKESFVKRDIASSIIMNLLIGSSSKLYKELYEKGVISSELSFDYEFTKQYAHAVIQGQSKEIDKVVEGLKNRIKEIKENGIDEEEFNLIKKKIYGGYVKDYNDVQTIGMMAIANYFNQINIFDYIENYNSVTKEYTEDILKDLFSEEKMVLSVIEEK